MGGIQGIAVVEEASPKKRDAESFKKSLADNSVVSVSHERLIAKEVIEEFAELGQKSGVFIETPRDTAIDEILHAARDIFRTCHDKRAIGKVRPYERKNAGAADFFCARQGAKA